MHSHSNSDSESSPGAGDNGSGIDEHNNFATKREHHQEHGYDDEKKEFGCTDQDDTQSHDHDADQGDENGSYDTGVRAGTSKHKQSSKKKVASLFSSCLFYPLYHRNVFFMNFSPESIAKVQDALRYVESACQRQFW